MTERLKTLIKFIFAFILLLIAYLPTLKWMMQRWTAPESYYGHGFIIPLVSLFVIWQRRDLIKNIKMTSDAAGIFIIAAGLLIHLVCAALKIYFISGFSFVLVIFGLVLYFFGREMVGALIFPLFFLFMMIPLPLVLIGNLIVKLKLFVTEVATFVLNRIGFPSIRDGSVIRMPNSYISIEAPCSGLRSLISLLTLGLLFSYAVKISYLKKGILLLSSIPIALISNLLRVTLLAVVNDLYGQKAALGFFHDFLGYLVFGFAFLALFGIGKILENRVYDENK